jgi:two-component system, LytTR family, response regulator
MKVLLLDDEPPARRSLRRALGEIGVTDVREASSIEQAVGLIVEERPDVLLLDVQLRGGKEGFDLLDMLPAEGIPVVFVTGHADHALKAFEHRAVDYVLKPVDPQRLKESLSRVSNELSDQGGERFFLRHERAMFRDGSKNVLVKIGDIQVLEAHDSYTKLILGDGTGPMVNGTLSSVLRKLDPEAFFRASRAKAINFDHVASIDERESGFEALMTNGSRVEMSRRQSAVFRQLKAI